MIGNIAILCSGGDVSGMNPAIKRFVEYSLEKSLTPYLIFDGYEGLIDGHIKQATYEDVAGIITRGGTKLGSSRSLRFKQTKYQDIAYEHLKSKNITMLVVLGGDGSFRGMQAFHHHTGITCCGIPSTIDNDIAGTDYCLGVDTALNIIKDSIDAIRDTASSFRRAFVIETMGRNCGYLALISALTSGAEMCLIPEIPYELSMYESCFKQQKLNGRRYFIAILAEGSSHSSGELTQWFEEKIGIESRATVLGHIQRGGNPSIYDRLMAYRFVTYAIDGLLKGRKSSVICYTQSHFEYKDIDDVANNHYVIDEKLLDFAKDLGCHNL